MVNSARRERERGRRRRVLLSLVGLDQCREAIDRALALDFPPGYVAQIDWRSTAKQAKVAQENRAEMAATGKGWGNGTIECLVKPGAHNGRPAWLPRPPVRGAR